MRLIQAGCSRIIVVGLTLMMGLWCVIAQAMTTDEALKALSGRDFTAKKEAITTIAASGEPYATDLFTALDKGELFFRKSDELMVIRQGETFVNLTDKQAVAGDSSDFKRVAMNNALRRQIAELSAQLALNDPNAEKRLNAVKSMLGKVADSDRAALIAHQQKETDAKVLAAYDMVIAFSKLVDSDAAVRLSAVDALSEVHNPEVVGQLKSVAQNDTDAKVKSAAAAAVKKLERSQSFYSGIETLYFGISLGSILVLAGIGLAITFGVMGVINMAHGEMMMLGAYTTFVMQKLLPNEPGIALLLSIPAAFCVSGLVGIVIERSVIRFLYGRPLETLLATFGISLLLQQAVRSIFSPLNQSVVMPSWMSGTWVWNDFLSLTLNRMFIILFSLLVFAGLMWLLKRSRLGLEVRAVSQNRAMARNMGVRSDWVNARTFGLGSGIAGIAGVALSQLTNVGPNLGQGYIIDSFMVVVFGGVGNLWGTLVAGLSLGVANKLLEPYAGAVLAKILILVAIILFIQKRPRGLFPQRGRAVEG